MESGTLKYTYFPLFMRKALTWAVRHAFRIYYFGGEAEELPPPSDCRVY
ncbi:hypothetical protein CLOSTHATH_06902 [Hungatella hathewayi DSM 13479]|uniref:Uncharacterized protein n=1 Tax=Hungatella hathewayi DSM 13479 TaxID=566550 RepID=D3ATE3_9FIRM|nr:hypothetical protein CLOSTHATH_06902 [Hungatella hathewayi DSM 13479]